jgi:hypothetical protein
MITLLAMISAAAEYRFDEEEPDVKDRVARISYVKGDVQIKRSDNDQWERVVLNLPIVEGDEITAGPDSRFEIQFGAYSHLRVFERSSLKITSLKDNLVSVSLPEGNLSVSLARFDPDREAFEIDAPLTTVALLKQGRYRVDAGPAGYEAIRVSIPEQGEARVYSNNSGFTLHEGRSTRIFVSGRYLGEFENSDAAQFVDTFDRWALDRDESIAKRQAQAYYGRYYDTDIYGADDLNDNGEWINTPDYGYVWRPFRNVVSGYADWSPYRYGSWRWVPGYGWSWVNDEPWGWATYHHGRWIWYNGGWYWAPYGYYRQHRSWWYPALVVLNVINNNVCWYPLPYHARYNNYNRHYNRRRHDDDDRRRTINNTAVTQTPVRGAPVEPQRNIVVTPPDSSVVAISVDEFGKGRGNFNRVPRELGRNIIARSPVNDDDGPQLPTMRDIGTKLSSDIRVLRPQEPSRATPVTVGAAKRADDGEPMDKGLQNRIIRGDRPFLAPKSSDDGEPSEPGPRRNVPTTGAVGRPQKKADDGDRGEPQRVVIEAPKDDSTPARTVPRNDSPQQRQEPREPSRRDTPMVVIPQRTEPQRSEPQRRSDPPQQRSEPQKRSDPPPQRSEPKSEPQKRSDPPPQKSEPPKSEPSKQPGKTRDT